VPGKQENESPSSEVHPPNLLEPLWGTSTDFSRVVRDYQPAP
jgi:hypothetical protein